MAQQYKYGDTVFMVGRAMKGKRPEVLTYFFIAHSQEFPGYAQVSQLNTETGELYQPFTAFRTNSLYARRSQAEAAARVSVTHKPRPKRQPRGRNMQDMWNLPAKNYHDRDVA